MGGGGEWERWSRVVRQHYAPRAIMFSYHPALPQHTDTLKDGKGSVGNEPMTFNVMGWHFNQLSYWVRYFGFLTI